MKAGWPLQDAKNRFCEVVELALSKGPQWVTRRGKDAVVVVSARDFRKINRRRGSLAAFFRRSPLAGVRLDLRRSRDTGRIVAL